AAIGCRKAAPCLVGLEACATAHYWARELRALGHEVAPRYAPPRTSNVICRRRGRRETASTMTGRAAAVVHRARQRPSLRPRHRPVLVSAHRLPPVSSR